MELRDGGAELETRDTSDVFLRDLVITKTKRIRCEGKANRRNAKRMGSRGFTALIGIGI